jgi:hypothetical protein
MQEIEHSVADIDEFKGRWKVMETLAPEKLTSLRVSPPKKPNPASSVEAA